MQANPNAEFQAAGKEHTEKSTTFPCPACGGKMTFNPASQRLTCTHCGNSVAVDAVSAKAQKHDFHAAPRTGNPSNWEKDKRSIKCQSCGASTMIAENTTATFCPFCGAPHVVEDTASQGISPETLLPFTLDEAKAKEMFKAWVQKRHMAPAALKTNASMGRLSGVYLPHWSFDTDTDSHYVGREGHHYYETETYYEEENGKRVQKTRQVQKTRWYGTSGFVSQSFEDVTVPATSHIKAELLSGVGPFPIDRLTPYQPQYISGFLAENASVDIDSGWTSAKQGIDCEIENLCRDDILSHADEAEVQRVDTNYEDIEYKQFLLPVWLSAYKFKGKSYQFVINGQTGKVKGESPVSKVKVALIVMASLLLLAGIIWFVMESELDDDTSFSYGADSISYDYDYDIDPD